MGESTLDTAPYTAWQVSFVADTTAMAVGLCRSVT